MDEYPDPSNPDRVGLLGAVATGLFALIMVVAAFRSADVDVASFFELPAVTAWLFLVVLDVQPNVRRSDDAGSRRNAQIGPTAWIAVGVAVVHTAAWWNGTAALASAASGITIASIVVFVAAHRMSWTDVADVADLAAVIALVMLVATLALEVADSVATARSTIPPALLAARGPSIGSIAVLVGLSRVERGMRADAASPAAMNHRPRSLADDGAGAVFVMLFAVGWVALIIGAATGHPGVQVTSVGLHVVALTLFLVRMAPSLLSVFTDARRRWFVVCVLYVAAYVGLLFHLGVGLVNGTYADGSLIPHWLVISVDLIVFAGLAGNAMYAVVVRSGASGFLGLLSSMFCAFNVGVVLAMFASATASDTVARVGWVIGAATAVVIAALVAADVANAGVRRPVIPGATTV